MTERIWRDRSQTPTKSRTLRGEGFTQGRQPAADAEVVRPPWRTTTTHRFPSSDSRRHGAGVEECVLNPLLNHQVGEDRLSAIIEQKILQFFPSEREY